jgi:hypothetical protein
LIQITFFHRPTSYQFRNPRKALEHIVFDWRSEGIPFLFPVFCDEACKHGRIHLPIELVSKEAIVNKLAVDIKAIFKT